MTNMKLTAVLAIAGLAFSTHAFAQDAAATTPDITADAETRAMAEKINTPSTEGVVTDEDSCVYEGGSVEFMVVNKATACFIPIRPEIASAKIYDGTGMGVMRCSGNGEFSNEVHPALDSYCYVYLTEKIIPKTREELEREQAEATQRELESAN